MSIHNVGIIMLKEEVGARLRECRTAMGLTQKEVAVRLGVAQPIYNRFENGVFECNYEQLKALSQILDVSTDYLLGITKY